LQIEDVIAQAEAELCCLAREESETQWAAVRRGIPPAAGNIEARRDPLLGDEQVQFRLENLYRGSSGTTSLGRRAALWLSMALRSQVSAQAQHRRKLKQAIALVQSFGGQVGRERLGIQGLRMVMVRDSDRTRREQAYLALAALAKALWPPQREVLAGLSQAWSPARPGAGKVTYWNQPLSPFHMDWGAVDLPSLAARFLDATDELQQRFVHFAARMLGLRSLRAWDLDYAVLQFSRNFDAHFPVADATAGLVRGMRACGLNIDSFPIAPELHPKWFPPERSAVPAVGWATLAVPGEAALRGDATVTARARIRPRVVTSADYGPGAQYGWVQLAQATGVALGILYGRGGFLAERSLPPQLDPAALLVSDLVTEPNWLAGQTSIARSEVPRFLYLGCLRAGLLQTVAMRQTAARAAAAWQVMAQPGDDPAQEAARMMARASGVSGIDMNMPGLDLATFAEPGFWPSVFLCELAAGQARAFLRREHGKIMGDRRTGEFLVEYFWRPGRMLSIAQALAMATGGPLDPAHLAAELSHSADG
jgi:hypothetical protein